ncbi:hypothetical protein TrVE_jg8623 [Triparma verrucosa]|uniref:SprT-like domain-containing protein n=1 Tax=Triparma verrucosa TaxID=1606542 RepID=A0A9W7KUH9_9STRA|nr:hypothetical protein TrVE_jg8623 [Triparma verrucosa]
MSTAAVNTAVYNKFLAKARLYRPLWLQLATARASSNSISPPAAVAPLPEMTFCIATCACCPPSSSNNKIDNINNSDSGRRFSTSSFGSSSEYGNDVSKITESSDESWLQHSPGFQHKRMEISINDSTSTAGKPVMGLDSGKVFVDNNRMVTAANASASSDSGKDALAWLNASPVLRVPDKISAKNRDSLVQSLKSDYLHRVFDNKINPEITWSNRLQTTAGLTRLKKMGAKRTSSIELSVKVLSDVVRLKSTLLHELCHVAQWEIDNNKSPAHGKVFEKWRDRCHEVCRDVVVSKTHGYEIEYKYKYKCQSSFCGRVFGRQSKSIDVLKKVCGDCKGKLVLVEKDGVTPKKAKKLTEYQKFVKKESAKVRNEMGKKMQRGQKIDGKEVMREVGKRWKGEKERRKAEGTDDRDYDFSGSESEPENDENDESYILGNRSFVIDEDCDDDVEVDADAADVELFKALSI